MPKALNLQLKQYGIRKRDYKKFFTVLEDSAISTVATMTRELAEELVEDLKESIEYQIFDWKPLSEKYLEWKMQEGLDERIMIATGDYLDSIAVIEIVRGRGIQVRVGLPDAVATESGLTYDQLARVHEFGSRKMKIPSRPHWRPLYKQAQRRSLEMKKEAIKEIKEKHAKEMKKISVPKARAKRSRR